MFRQILFIALSLTFFVTLQFPHTVFAQEEATAPATIDYDLPYPGLLPDNPLYIVKAARDNLQAIFTSNPMERAAFDLQLADKRMEAGYILADQKSKLELAEMTISKGENYFEDAITRVQQANKQGVNVTEFAHKLQLANRKHQEVITNIVNSSTGDAKEKFIAERERARKLGETVKAINK